MKLDEDVFLVFYKRGLLNKQVSKEVAIIIKTSLISSLYVREGIHDKTGVTASFSHRIILQYNEISGVLECTFPFNISSRKKHGELGQVTCLLRLLLSRSTRK